ncbi:MAG: 3-oxoacyl-ACP reductase [Acidobacteria bacterium]|nr:MAG: 3-oxoacyl-ACP reductase [Acidobacteriota bacterium]
METGLRGKTVLITGASQGMGRATAEAFAAEGARLAMCARNQKTLEAAQAEISSRHKTEVMVEAVDVTDADKLRRFVAAAAAHFGGIDVAVANAGGPPAKNFLSLTPDDWRKAVDVNFLSVVTLAREVIPHMQRKRWGRFITITSTSVRQPIPDLLLSNSVRPAVVGLIKSLAIEFGKDGLTFNNIAPGYTATERLSELSKVRALAAGTSEEQIRERWAQEIPLRRLGEPQEIADAIIWLASDRAAYVTGQTLVVDGGNYRGL